MNMKFPIIHESYNFDCTRCGNCCTGDQKVNLNPYDLHKMASYKKFKHTKDLFDNNFVQLVKSQNEAWIPQIKFKSIFSKKLKFCPFLINSIDENKLLSGLCSLHPKLKPLICSMAPVGRILDFKAQTEQFIFVKPAPDCPGVEIDKANNLADLKYQMKFELSHEKKFLKKLDQIKKGNYSKNYYLQSLYLFPVTDPFKWY